MHWGRGEEEAGSRRQEARSQRSVVRGQESGVRIQRFGGGYRERERRKQQSQGQIASRIADAGSMKESRVGRRLRPITSKKETRRSWIQGAGLKNGDCRVRETGLSEAAEIEVRCV